MNSNISTHLNFQFRPIARRSGTDSVNVQQHMLNSLGEGTFYLQDFEMDAVEIPLLVKFLQSKTVSFHKFTSGYCTAAPSSYTTATLSNDLFIHVITIPSMFLPPEFLI